MFHFLFQKTCIAFTGMLACVYVPMSVCLCAHVCVCVCEEHSIEGGLKDGGALVSLQACVFTDSPHKPASLPTTPPSRVLWEAAVSSVFREGC